MKIISSLVRRAISWKTIKNNCKSLLKERRKIAKITGAIGGEKIKRKYGIEYYKQIAKRGAKKGGLTVYHKYGSEIYRKMGLKGGSKGGKKGGVTAAKISPLTVQEKSFLRYVLNNGYLCYSIVKNNVKLYQQDLSFKNISKLKLKRILKTKDKICEIKSILKADRNYVVDFVLYMPNKLKAIVECTRVKARNISTYLKAVELCIRKKELEKFNPSTMFIAIVSDKMPTEAVLRLLDDYVVIFDTNLKKLLNYLEDPSKILKINVKTYEYFKKLESKKQRKCVLASQKRIRTRQEKKVLELLEANKFNFQFGFPITSNVNSKHFTDFAIFDKDYQPKIIIEVTSVNDNSYKSIMRGALRLWTKIDFYKRYCNNQPYYVGILNGSSDINYQEVYKIGSICDLFVVNNTLSELPKLLRKIERKETKIDDKKIIDLWKKVKG